MRCSKVSKLGSDQTRRHIAHHFDRSMCFSHETYYTSFLLGPVEYCFELDRNPMKLFRSRCLFPSHCRWLGSSRCRICSRCHCQSRLCSVIRWSQFPLQSLSHSLPMSQTLPYWQSLSQMQSQSLSHPQSHSEVATGKFRMSYLVRSSLTS